MMHVMIKNISKVYHNPSMLEVLSESKPRKANKSKPIRAKASILHTFTSTGDVSIQVKYSQTRPMGHIAHLRNQFKSMNTFERSFDHIYYKTGPVIQGEKMLCAKFG